MATITKTIEVEVEVELDSDDLDIHVLGEFIDEQGIPPQDIYRSDDLIDALPDSERVLRHIILGRRVSSELITQILRESDHGWPLLVEAPTPPPSNPMRDPSDALAALLKYFGTYEDLLAWLAGKMQRDGTGTMAQVILTGSGLGFVANELSEAWDKEFMRRIRLISGKA